MRSVVLLASFAATASTAWAEVPLAELTTQQVRDAMSKELTREVQASYAPKPEGLVYRFVDGMPSLVWSYSAAQALPEDQATRLKSLLIEACVQHKDANGNSLLTGEDGQKLRDSLSFINKPIEPPPVDPPVAPPVPTPISIPKIADVTITSGSPRVIPFQVLNADASPSPVTVTAASSDPRLITPDDLQLGGAGVDRTLLIKSRPGMGGKATISVTASKVGGESSTASFSVSLITMSSPPPPSDPAPPVISAPPVSSAQVVFTSPTISYPAMTYPTATYPTATYPAMSTARSPVVRGGHCCLFRKKCGGRMGACSTAAPCGEMGPSYPSMTMPIAAGQSPYYAPTASYSTFPSPVETAFGPIVPRSVLLQGKTAEDWEPLFNDGYRAFRSGDYARAVEYFAAAADLNDDPRAWDFLAMASIMTRDPKTARAAAQYSAARVFTRPAIAKASAMALVDVPGTIRDRLMEYKSEVDQARFARSILAARPKLRAELTELAGKGRSESTVIAVTGR